MPRGASSCAHISVDRCTARARFIRRCFGKSMIPCPFDAPRCTHMAARWVMILLAGCSALVAAGCATSVPRFRSHDVEHPSEARSRVSALRRARPAEDAPLPPALNRDRVLLDIVSMLGVPYSYGGSDEAGIDCSGFTALVYDRALGFRLPRSTSDQFQEGAAVDRDGLRFGDLVFFNTTGDSPSHVGIYIEDDLFAHASVSVGVTLSSMESAYYRDRFIGARRVIE